MNTWEALKGHIKPIECEWCTCLGREDNPIYDVGAYYIQKYVCQNCLEKEEWEEDES